MNKLLRETIKRKFCLNIFHKFNKKKCKYILPPRQCPTMRKVFPHLKLEDCKIKKCKHCDFIDKMFKEMEQ